MISIINKQIIIFQELQKLTIHHKSRVCNSKKKVPSIGKGNKYKNNIFIRRQIQKQIGVSKTAKQMMFEYFPYTACKIKKIISKSISVPYARKFIVPNSWVLSSFGEICFITIPETGSSIIFINLWLFEFEAPVFQIGNSLVLFILIY